MKKKHYILLTLLLVAIQAMGQGGMNRPYIDDKVVHFGFSLSVNFMDYATHESGLKDSITGEVWHVRQSMLMPGFSVGFITDLRLSRHLNFRCTPMLHFGQRTLSYVSDQDKKANTDVLALPISIPLYLKWSAEREGNYRPYLIGGGGVSFDFGPNKEKPVLQKTFDYFVEVGAGCDFYFRWFKFCPQLTYSIGFNNVLVPIAEREPKPEDRNHFYTNAMTKMLNRQLTLTFNFE